MASLGLGVLRPGSTPAERTRPRLVPTRALILRLRKTI
jgi:hypothetical protein